MIIDALCVWVSLRVAVWIRPDLNEFLTFTKDIAGPISLHPAIYPIFAVLWVLILQLFSVYDTRKHPRFFSEITSLMMGSLLAVVSLSGLLYLTFREYSRALFVSFVVFAFVLMLVVRVGYRIYFQLVAQRGVQTRRVLIIGAGPLGKAVARRMDGLNTMGLKLAGYLDDDPQKQGQTLVLGPIPRVREIIRRENINDVVLALPNRALNKINHLTVELHDLPVQVWVVPDYYSLSLNQARVEELAGIPMIDLRAPALNDYQRLVKRSFDIVFSVLVLPFALILMAVFAIAIRLDSPGAIIFKQKRVGENGRLFDMLKFRTMFEGAEKHRYFIESVDENGRISQDKRRSDPRVTTVGRILRRTSMDELPQIFNVLWGEMSIVGPRPEMPHLVKQYQPWQRQRFAVPQGITGWWQVNGRSDKPMHQNTEDDLYYVKNYSLWLDIMIILKTVWVVFRRKGAY